MVINTQLELEEQNLQIVITKTMNTINKADSSRSVSDLSQSRNITTYYVTELDNRLKLYIAEVMNGDAKVKPVPAKVLLLIPTLSLAHFTVKCVVNNIGAKNITAATMYANIAKQLEIEYSMLKLKELDSKRFDVMASFIKNSSYSGFRLTKITTDLLTKYHKDVVSTNMNHTFMQVAQLAIYCLADCQPIINGNVTPPLLHMTTVIDKQASRPGDIKSKVKIVPADWFLEWIREQTLEGNMMPSYHTPMIEKPLPWTTLTNGGFHSARLKTQFIKTECDHSHFNVTEMKSTMDAINILQDTAWEINTDVLTVMNYAFVNKLDWGKLPAPLELNAVPYPYPGKPRTELNEEQAATVKAWATHKAHLHDQYHSEVSRYLALSRVLGEAKRFKNYSKLYYAYQVDFRGRVYPIAANLHPQGATFVKPLLRFAEGKLINNKKAEMYLALQGANTYGKDKIRLEQKHEWVLSISSKILEAANDPISSSFWKEADEPWSFLAFCFEWRDYTNSPSTFLSKLPIALDGSCNGLQHLSAMMRDEVGGKEVNLTNNFDKEDIYLAVKRVADIKLKANGSVMAQRLLKFGIERSTCKRPVMIIPYAGTQNACRHYITDDFNERNARDFFGEDFTAAITLATSVIWEAIGDVIIKGREVMEWFKRAAKKSVKHSGGVELSWVTPNGFKVVQKRTKMLDSLYQTTLGESIPVRLSMRLKIETDKPDMSGHASSVSPNFIHSLDACALQQTVLRCAENGISSLAMIHDSYGTHAADTEKMNRYIRECFYEMYSDNDVLKDWISQQPLEAQKEFIELPRLGTLNLKEVLDSEHFFA